MIGVKSKAHHLSVPAPPSSHAATPDRVKVHQHFDVDPDTASKAQAKYLQPPTSPTVPDLSVRASPLSSSPTDPILFLRAKLGSTAAKRNKTVLAEVLSRISRNYDPLLNASPKVRSHVENAAACQQALEEIKKNRKRTITPTEALEREIRRREKRPDKPPPPKKEIPSLHPTTEKLLQSERRKAALASVKRTLADPLRSENLPRVLEQLHRRASPRAPLLPGPVGRILMEEFESFQGRKEQAQQQQQQQVAVEQSFSPGKVLDVGIPSTPTRKPRFDLKAHLASKKKTFKEYFLFKHSHRKKRDNPRQLEREEGGWVVRTQHRFSRTFLLSKFPALSPHNLHKLRVIQRRWLRGRKRRRVNPYQASLITRLKTRELLELDHNGELVRELVHDSVRRGVRPAFSVAAADVMAKAVQVFVRRAIAREAGEETRVGEVEEDDEEEEGEEVEERLEEVEEEESNEKLEVDMGACIF